jgi:hypothetical protein
MIMSLHSIKTIDECQEGKVLLIEETLSDGSLVYEIRIYSDSDFGSSYTTINCINQESADELFTTIGYESAYIFNY